MASVNQIVHLIAERFGYQPTTVEAYAKTLRKAGHITPGVRGRGAVDMTVEDLAALFAALLAGSPTHAVKSVEQCRQMKTVCQPIESFDARTHCMMALFDLEPGHSLLDGMAGFIRYAAERYPNALPSLGRKIMRAAPDTYPAPEKTDDLFIRGRIEVERPQMESAIKVTPQWQELIAGQDYKSDSADAWIYYEATEQCPDVDLSIPAVRGTTDWFDLDTVAEIAGHLNK